jgi:hypothetical protein
MRKIEALTFLFGSLIISTNIFNAEYIIPKKANIFKRRPCLRKGLGILDYKPAKKEDRGLRYCKLWFELLW